MSTIIQRFVKSTSPPQSYFLFGPRGTGKSTWLKKQYPQALLIDLLQPDLLRKYLAYPERLLEVINNTTTTTIIIDEVQKAPELLTVVHKLIEQKDGKQFILTGSSARKLKHTGVDLLAGRAIIRQMHPFMAAELKDQFSISQALQYGMIPLIQQSQEIDDVAKAYISLYLNEEVQAEGLVRNIGNFSRFLEIMSFSHGTLLNLNNIARECIVSRKLVENYLNILQDLLLCHLLRSFTVRAKRKITTHPKFYYFDTGIYHSLRPIGFIDTATEIDGPGLEGLVLQHLLAWNEYSNGNNKIFYWRTKHGVEVDFIIYGPKFFYAIEVKNNVNVNNSDLSSLKAFMLDYKEATPIFLYRGKEKIKKQDVWCLPVDEFLINLIPGKNLINI